jgi:ribose 5-phosphate isomerase B
MQIFLGADHGGFQLKEQLKAWLAASGQNVVDCGALTLTPDDDYPEYAAAVGRKVAESKNGAVGFVICKSGGGVTIAANKINGVRAAELFDEKTTRHAREDNDVNVGAFSGLWQSLDEMKILIAEFLATPFSGAERHQRRINQIKNLE